jgi:hypothetical protein
METYRNKLNNNNNNNNKLYRCLNFGESKGETRCTTVAAKDQAISKNPCE